MPQACRALQEQEASQVLRETVVSLVSVESLESRGQQGLLEPWVHRDPQVPGAPQDPRGTEVLLGTKEQRERVDFQTSLL